MKNTDGKRTEKRPSRRFCLRLLGALIGEHRNYGLFSDIEELFERQVSAAGLVLGIGFLTTSYHSVRAASSDPGDSPRNE